MTRPRLVLLAVVLAAGLAWLVERLIVTDTEAITSVLEGAAAAVSRDDWDAYAGVIDDEFADPPRDKAAFVAWSKGLARTIGLRAVTVDVAEVRVDGDQARARVVVFPGGRLSGQGVPGRVELVRRAAGWRVVAAAPDDPRVLGR